MLDKFHIIIWQLVLRRLLQPLIYLIFSLLCYFTHQTPTHVLNSIHNLTTYEKKKINQEKKIVNSFIEIFAAAAALNSLLCSVCSFIHFIPIYFFYYYYLLVNGETTQTDVKMMNENTQKIKKNTQIYNFSTLSFYSSSPSDYNTYIYFICFP